MPCNFCQHTGVSPCPVCEIRYTRTPHAMRKGPKRTPNFRVAKVAMPPVGATYIPNKRVDQAVVDAGYRIAENERRMREISAQLAASAKARSARQVAPPLPPIVAQRPVSLRVVKVVGVFCDECDAGDFKPNGSVPVGMVRLPTGRIVCEACAAKKQARAGIVAGWHAAARVTLEALRRPMALESSQNRDTAAKTMPPVARGDWAGLGRAVDAGILTDAQAIALAASWKAAR